MRSTARRPWRPSSDELAMTALYEADQMVRMLLWQPRGRSCNCWSSIGADSASPASCAGFASLTGSP